MEELKNANHYILITKERKRKTSLEAYHTRSYNFHITAAWQFKKKSS